MPLEYLQRLRTQYPQYGDIPDQDLARRIIEKYPQYQDALGDIAAGSAGTPPPAQSITDPGAEILGGVSSQGAAKTLPEWLQRVGGLFWPGGLSRPKSYGQYEAESVAPPPPQATTPGGLAASAGSAALAGLQIGGVAGPAGRIAGGLVAPAATAARAAPVAASRLGEALAQRAPQAVEATGTAVDRVLQALKAAGPVRAEQEALYSAERSKRLGAAMAIGERVPGQTGFRQQLGALAGELPKAQFAPLKIDQPDIDALFNQIENSSMLTGFSKINAKVGLSKLFGALGGQVPTDSELSLLGRVFGGEFVASVMAKRPILSKLQNAAAIVGGTMKSLSASMDLSAPFRQGVFAAARFAPEFTSSFAPMVRAFASEGAYQGIAKEVASRPTFELMERAKLALTALSDTALTTGEEQYMASKIAERIPVLGRMVRGSDRAFSGFLTKFRADIFDSMVRDARTMGVDLNDIQLQRMAGFINTATGRGNLGSLAPAANALSTVLFSPRLIASRVQLLNPAYYVALDPFTRRYALQSAAAFYGSVSTVLGLAALAGARVGTDIRSADFGKIRVGNTRFEITGGFQPYLRLLGQLYTGQAISTITGMPETIRGQAITRKDIAQRFIEAKFAPLASTARDVLQGSQFGQPITVQQQIVSRFVPLVLQDLNDILTQEGPQALGRIIPGVFGVGVQTYGPPKNVSP